MRGGTHPTITKWYVMNEGGPLHTSDNISTYFHRLIPIGREKQAKILQQKHPEMKVNMITSDQEEETYDIPDIVENELENIGDWLWCLGYRR